MKTKQNKNLNRVYFNHLESTLSATRIAWLSYFVVAFTSLSHTLHTQQTNNWYSTINTECERNEMWKSLGQSNTSSSMRWPCVATMITDFRRTFFPFFVRECEAAQLIVSTNQGTVYGPSQKRMHSKWALALTSSWIHWTEAPIYADISLNKSGFWSS